MKITLEIKIQCNKKAECCGSCEYLYVPEQGFCSLFDEWLEHRGKGHERCMACLDKEKENR